MTPNPTNPNPTPAPSSNVQSSNVQSPPSSDPQPIIPEVVEPDGSTSDRPPASEAPQGWSEAKAKILKEIEAIARFMDGAFEIPLLGQPIGADALAGLLPIGGDLLTAIVSGYIVVRAKMMGVPKAKIWQMIGNIVIDTLLGSVPIAGDAFDVYWKANFRNIDIVRTHFGLGPFKP
ncbi:MAG: DUF4112 domain-containing protein [Prochlorothrix sp.]|nr:DUF4112 domain-containing protein [Prochlorothrix sp.]